MAERVCKRDGCSASLEGRREDADFCTDYCRFKHWVENNPEKRQQRLATARRVQKRPARKENRNGNGVRIYITRSDTQLRILQKAAEAFSRKDVR